jgi:hypothetical protein
LRHAERHLVLHEIDHEQLKTGACDFLLLDRQDLADAVSGIDHEFIGLEALTLGHDLLRLFDLGGGNHRLGGNLRRDHSGGLGSHGLGGYMLRGSGNSLVSDLRSSGLRTRRFRGSFGSLIWHCASFIFRGLCGRDLPGVLHRRLGTAFGCAAAGRGGFFGGL